MRTCIGNTTGTISKDFLAIVSSFALFEYLQFILSGFFSHLLDVFYSGFKIEES